MSKTTKPDLLGVEPIDYVYRGSDGLIYRTIPQDVPVIETIPRYSAATVERLVQERDRLQTIDLDLQMAVQKLAAMTKKADDFFDALQLAAKINAEGQAREQQLRDLMIRMRDKGDGEYWSQMNEVLSIPCDDTALRQWGAKLLREMSGKVDMLSCEDLLRKAEELEEKK